MAATEVKIIDPRVVYPYFLQTYDRGHGVWRSEYKRFRTEKEAQMQAEQMAYDRKDLVRIMKEEL